VSYSDEIVNAVYDRTGGYCAYCRRKIHFRNYGGGDGVGSWEIDHWTSKTRGGTETLSNLVPVCILCNRSKQDMTGDEFIDWLRDQSHQP